METSPKYYFKKIGEFPKPEIFDVKNTWEILKEKDDFLSKLKDLEIKGTMGRDVHFEGIVIIGAGSTIKHNTIIEGPVWVGENCTIGPGAYIRKGTIIGNNCELGRIEIKGSVIMNNVKAHHNGYIGDSIIGDSVNIGAGVVLTNFKFDGTNIKIDGKDTGLRKFGAVIGDSSSIGCNATTMPGTFIGPGCWVYPLCLVKGFVQENKILKHKTTYEVVDKK